MIYLWLFGLILSAVLLINLFESNKGKELRQAYYRSNYCNGSKALEQQIFGILRKCFDEESVANSAAYSPIYGRFFNNEFERQTLPAFRKNSIEFALKEMEENVGWKSLGRNQTEFDRLYSLNFVEQICQFSLDESTTKQILGSCLQEIHRLYRERLIELESKGL